LQNKKEDRSAQFFTQKYRWPDSDFKYAFGCQARAHALNREVKLVLYELICAGVNVQWHRAKAGKEIVTKYLILPIVDVDSVVEVRTGKKSEETTRP